MCNLANLHAINLMRVNDLNGALDWLKKCEQLSENNDRCLSITYNNMACYYKR